MTQEEKQLLLKDLCGRLPYHPQIHICNDSWEGVMIGEFDNALYCHHLEALWCDRIEIKPYLRPMSSMTEEEKILYHQYLKDGAFYEVEDFCNERHLDYRGLIEKGLAIEVTKIK